MASKNDFLEGTAVIALNVVKSYFSLLSLSKYDLVFIAFAVFTFYVQSQQSPVRFKSKIQCLSFSKYP